MMTSQPSRQAIAWTMTLLAGAFVVGASPQSSPTRATWRGVKTVVITAPRCDATNEESFVWVEETDAASERRWVSKRANWDNSGSCSGAGALAMVGGRREGAAWWVRCANRGQMDLMASNRRSTQPLCEQGPPGLLAMVPFPSVYSAPSNFGPVDRSQLRDGCTYNRREVYFPCCTAGTRIVETESITLDEANVSAKIFGGLYGEPTPGATFRVWGRANVPVRWKFVLVESSRLRGYATNADVNPAFFEIYDLMSLRGSYGTMDPDLIFDPAKYEPPWDQTRQWKRPYPGSGPTKWSILESREESTSASVEVTAMDFGAHGEIQVYVSSKCGGGWLRVEADDTTGAAGIAIPTDDADRNFISDSLKEYAGLAPLDDNDSEPVGDGTAGDGFTAFEEYRGFVTQTEMNCNSPVRVTHQRTNPVQKDLFIRASDPLLWRAARGFGGVGMQFGDVWTQPLAVHMICPAQYLSDDSRMVNFTMQVEPGEGIRGAKLTQDPQRGLRLVNEQMAGPLGEAIGFATSNPVRSPGVIDRVAIDVQAIRRAAIDDASAGAPVGFVSYLRLITFHELGHAVGIRHHGEDNIGGPVAFRKLACPTGMTEGTDASAPGVRICIARGIAVRGAQNSGSNDCPMKYTWWRWYVPAGSSLTGDNPVTYRPSGSWPWTQPRQLPAYIGRVLQYRKDRDRPGLIAFCPTSTGTGINALPGDENHAGDVSQPTPCVRQIRIKDPPGAGSP